MYVGKYQHFHLADSNGLETCLSKYFVQKHVTSSCNYLFDKCNRSSI